MRYTFNEKTEKTMFVDTSGNTVSEGAIRNQPVTVYYQKNGDQMVVNKIVAAGQQPRR